MTMTDETTTTTTSAVEFTLPWQTLSDLASVSATAASDVTRLILTAIHLVSDGATITATATDTYGLAIVTTTPPDDAPPAFDVLIPAQWMTAALKTTRAARFPEWRVRLTLTPTKYGGSVTLSALTGDISTTGTLTFGTFPAVTQVVPTAAQYVHERAAFTAGFIARMAKILPPDTGKRAGAPQPWVCEMMSATRPSVWTTRVRDCDGLFLLMPVHV